VFGGDVLRFLVIVFDYQGSCNILVADLSTGSQRRICKSHHFLQRRSPPSSPIYLTDRGRQSLPSRNHTVAIAAVAVHSPDPIRFHLFPL
ncbi:hypothetical protein PIB30_115582, partial [Stylosanthes scabra]|nr:hypothetical protein [Stylosanthes scabra]